MIATHHVTLRKGAGLQFTAHFDDVPGAPTLVFDEPAPLGDGRGPSASAVLAAAVGNCLAASLAFCLGRARVDLDDLEVHVAAHVDRNDGGRLRVTGIDVELRPAFGEADPGRVERCSTLFEDFCTVTASLRQGIPVSVTLAPSSSQPAAAARSAVA